MHDGAQRTWRRLAKAVTLGMAAVLTGAVMGASPAWAAEGLTYDYYLTGNGDDARPSVRPHLPTAVLMGGGPDVDAAFPWMIQKSGGGDFVVIRASGADGYNDYLYDMGGLDSVETLVVKTREAAYDPFVLKKVMHAEAIFIAGGDQSDYIKLWKGTPLHAALLYAQWRRIPLGGTSAGLAVLGQFDFAALNDTVVSEEALADPYNERMTLDRGFLVAPGLWGAVTDSHLDSRDRMGRLMGFVARTIQDGWVPTEVARGVGLAVETAMVVEGHVGRVLTNPDAEGSPAVYVLRPSAAPLVCQPGQPLTFRNVAVDRVPPGAWFDFRYGYGAGTTRYDLSAETGVMTSSQPGGSLY